MVLRSIGIDFDNTIVDYDAVFLHAAHDRQLLPRTFFGNKTQVRDTIRNLPDGNWRWTQLQAQVYGRDILQAVPFVGFGEFLTRASDARIPLYVISHKSRYAAADIDGIDLREAAFGWLRAQGYLGTGGPLNVDSIYFETERSAKIARIATTGCTDFIDDLLDILDDRAFPKNVRRYHFCGALDASASGFHSWSAISSAIFNL